MGFSKDMRFYSFKKLDSDGFFPKIYWPSKRDQQNHISLERIHQSPSELNPGVSRKADVNSLEGERVCLQIPYLPWFINVPSSCMVYLFTIFVFSWFIIISPSAYPSFGNKKTFRHPNAISSWQ
jgi:hypothetical protein